MVFFHLCVRLSSAILSHIPERFKMPAMRAHRSTTPERKPYVLIPPHDASPSGKSDASRRSTMSSSAKSITTDRYKPPTSNEDEDELDDGSGSGTDVEPAIKPKASKKAAAGASPGRGRAWTPAERLLLFDIAVTTGASSKSFDAVIPGRTAKQCYDTWK